jgi:signal recognition particle subunit SRP54
VNRLIKQFSETRKLMKMMTTGKGKNLSRMMDNMGAMKGM